MQKKGKSMCAVFLGIVLVALSMLDVVPVNAYTGSGSVSANEVDYWWISNVNKDDLVLLNIQADTFPYGWESRLYYSNLTVVQEIDDDDTHIYEFIANKTDDYLLRLHAGFSFNYTIECTHLVLGHNVAITDVWTDKTIVFQGELLKIYVNISNIGNFTETIDVTAFYNSTPVETIKVENLVPDESRTLEFVCSITVIGNYTISADCSIFQYEIDTTDNNKTDGVVWVKSDNTPPYIDTPSQNPPRDNVMPDQEVKVSVSVTDVESGVKNVTLFYTINNGTSWEPPRPMSYNSTTGYYETTIPGQPADTWVKFKIVAYDYAGNNATKDGTEPYCTYQVIPEFPSFMIMPLFMIVTLLAVIRLKKRKHLTIPNKIG